MSRAGSPVTSPKEFPLLFICLFICHNNSDSTSHSTLVLRLLTNSDGLLVHLPDPYVCSRDKPRWHMDNLGRSGLSAKSLAWHKLSTAMETLTEHVQLVKSLFSANHTRKRLIFPGVPDTTESGWYEPWNHIFHWLRLCTSKQLTIAPQLRVTTVVHHDENGELWEEEWSLSVNDISSGSIEPESYEDYTFDASVQIPDFVVSRPVGSDRAIVLIGEAKPPLGAPVHNPSSLQKPTAAMIWQILRQARHALESSGAERIFLLNIIGDHFCMNFVDRENLHKLPRLPFEVRKREDSEIEGYLMAYAANLQVQPVFSEVRSG